MKFVFCRLVGVFCALFGLVATGYAMPYTFDYDNQGWEQGFVGRPEGTTYDQLFENEPADWDSDSGNPPGSIYQTAQGIDKRAYGMGYLEPNFLGDLTGMKLTVDLWSTNTGAPSPMASMVMMEMYMHVGLFQKRMVQLLMGSHW